MPTWGDWNVAYTKKGKARIFKTRAMRLLALFLAVVGLYRARRSRIAFRDARLAMQRFLRETIATVIQAGTSLRSHAVAAVSK